eukprot:m.203700 g.203700  ORF g.203700 m.203700 type:complete len:93 (-) comp26010_c1_seq7:93-371(-)
MLKRRRHEQDALNKSITSRYSNIANNSSSGKTSKGFSSCSQDIRNLNNYDLIHKLTHFVRNRSRPHTHTFTCTRATKPLVLGHPAESQRGRC